MGIIHSVLTSEINSYNQQFLVEIASYDNLRLHVVCLENCMLLSGIPCTCQYGACSMVSDGV